MIENYLDHIEKQCTTEQIKNVLRNTKEKYKDVLIGSTKNEAISNLKLAFDAKRISLVDVHTLLSDGEEYGNQYVYLFEPQHESLKRKYSDPDHIFRSLFGYKSKKELDFPILTNMPKRLTWVDFRSKKEGYKDQWLLKMYDKDSYWKQTSVEETANKRTIVSELQETRLIYLARWNEFDQLEIRITQTGSTPNSMQRLLRLKKFLQKLKQAIDMKHFKLRNLDNVRYNLIDHQSVNRLFYKFSRTSLHDTDNGTATIDTKEVSGDLFSSSLREQTINSYLSNQGLSDSLKIHFLMYRDNLINLLPVKDGVSLSKETMRLLKLANDSGKYHDILVHLGLSVHQRNEFLIGSKIYPEDYRYILRVINEFK